MSRVQEAFYRVAPHILDVSPDDAGVRSVAGRRIVFFQTRLFAHLFGDMREVTGPVIDSRIRSFGEDAGREIASKMDAALKDASLLDTVRLLVRSGFDLQALRELGKDDPRSQLEKIFGLGMYDGWMGAVTVEEYRAGERLVIEAENTFESYSYGDDEAARCRFMQGVLTGLLGYYWDADDLEAEETACRCAGADACRMVVTNGS